MGVIMGLYRVLLGLCRGYIGLYRGYIGNTGIMEKKRETAISGLGFN